MFGHRFQTFGIFERVMKQSQQNNLKEYECFGLLGSNKNLMEIRQNVKHIPCKHQGKVESIPTKIPFQNKNVRSF